jgi:hypothetical protein
MLFRTTSFKLILMTAMKFFVLAVFLLAASPAQSKERKANPPVGLSTGGLNGASLPRSWPFEPRVPAAGPVAAGIVRLPQPEAPAESFIQSKPDPVDLYFLLKAKSVETGDGIVDLTRGAKLHKQSDGSYLSSGVKLTLPDNEVTNDPELARQPAVSDQAPQPAVREPGHARIGASLEDFRHTPNLQWIGGSLFQLGSYSVMAVFLDGRCQELTFADLVQETVANKVLRDTKRSSGQYDKFFQSVLDANAGTSKWIEETVNPEFRKWRRADGALKAEATNSEAIAGIITLTTSELTQHRKERSSDGQRVALEGL